MPLLMRKDDAITVSGFDQEVIGERFATNRLTELHSRRLQNLVECGPFPYRLLTLFIFGPNTETRESCHFTQAHSDFPAFFAPHDEGEIRLGRPGCMAPIRECECKS